MTETTCRQVSEINKIFEQTTITTQQRQRLCEYLYEVNIPDTSDLFFGLDTGVMRLFKAIDDGDTEETFYHESDSERHHQGICIDSESIKTYINEALTPLALYCQNEFTDEQKSALQNIITRLFFPTDFHLPKMKTNFRKGSFLVGATVHLLLDKKQMQ